MSSATCRLIPLLILLPASLAAQATPDSVARRLRPGQNVRLHSQAGQSSVHDPDREAFHGLDQGTTGQGHPAYSVTTLSRSIALAVLLAAAPPATVLAQAPRRAADNPCFRARPAPECSVFFITNAGGYIKPGRTNGGSPLRAIVDWGVMVNASPRHAIGGSWFVTLDEDDFSTGPAVHYRRWFEGNRSLDVALGTTVAGDNLKAGSILGLVKYNPVHWFGVGVRPEYLRRSAFTCGPSTCTEYTATSVRVYGGVEFGWVPGLALSLGGGAALGLLVAAYAGSN